MSENKKIYAAIMDYLAAEEMQRIEVIPGKLTTWQDLDNQTEFSLPEPDFIEHRQAKSLLNEAIETLAELNQTTFEDFKNHLLTFNVDIIKARASGNKVYKGKINLQEGVSAFNGFFELLKLSVRRTKTVKHSKTKYEKAYLDSLRMLAPEKGSFIFSIESDLAASTYKTEDEKNHKELFQDHSFGRIVNSAFAKQLVNLSTMVKKKGVISAEMLVESGIDSSFCDHFLSLFSRSADGLDFEFKWSPKEPVSTDIPTKISFNNDDRSSVVRYKQKLLAAKERDYINRPAYIEGSRWSLNDTSKNIYFKICLNDGEPFKSCKFEIEDDDNNNIFSKLAALVQPNHKVLVDARIKIETGKGRDTTTVKEVYRINSEEGKKLY